MFMSAPALRGRVVEARGVIVRVVGVSLRIGEKVRLVRPDTLEAQYGEVVGFAHDGALVMPLAGLAGLSDITEVQGCGSAWGTFDATRAARTGGGRARQSARRRSCAAACSRPPRWPAGPMPAATLNPLERPVIATPFATGVRAIDGLLTCGVGQRTGIFAPAGGGKSTIMGMIANGASTDAIVVA